MLILALDTETSEKPRHFPWIPGSYLSLVCLVSYNTTTKHKQLFSFVFNHSEVDADSHANKIIHIQSLIDTHDLLVGHNIKFDLHWLHSIGITYKHKKLFCTQVAEYMLTGQDKTIPLSLHELSIKYGLAPKIDKAKFYWDSGYATDEIPLSILIPYCEQDTINALSICIKQLRQITDTNKKLIWLHMRFINIIQMIEYNGMKLDINKIDENIPIYNSKLSEIEFKILDILLTKFPELEEIKDKININSDQQLSAILYGGDIKYIGTEKYYKEYKQKGLVEKERKATLAINIKGLGFIPLKNTETKKEGTYKTDKGTLDSLKYKTKLQKIFVELLKEYSKIEKIKATYLEGLKEREINGIVHCNINQTVTSTGRLSASNPNLQNQPRSGTDSIVKELFISRFTTQDK